MASSLFQLAPPMATPPPGHVRLHQRPRQHLALKSVSAPPLVSKPRLKSLTSTEDQFFLQESRHLSKAVQTTPILFALDEPQQEVKTPPTQEKALKLGNAEDIKAKILEANRILAAFHQKKQTLGSPDERGQGPHRADLVVLAKPGLPDQPASLKKIPLPFHSAGMWKDLVQTFLTGQLNGNTLKNYFSNQFALKINHAKFSITHFHEDDNQNFTESFLQFSRQEKSALQETARVYGYNPQDTKEMAAYYKELLHLQAEFSAGNKNQDWGIAFHYKKGTRKPTPLELPQ